MKKRENSDWKSYIVITNRYNNIKCAIATRNDVNSITEMRSVLVAIAQRICEINNCTYMFTKQALNTNVLVLDFDDYKG